MQCYRFWIDWIYDCVIINIIFCRFLCLGSVSPFCFSQLKLGYACMALWWASFFFTVHTCLEMNFNEFPVNFVSWATFQTSRRRHHGLTRPISQIRPSDTSSSDSFGMYYSLLIQNIRDFSWMYKFVVLWCVSSNQNFIYFFTREPHFKTRD